jgi:hypothetical protein
VHEPQIIEVQVVELIAGGIRAMSRMYITKCIVIPTTSPGSSGRGVTLLGHCSSPSNVFTCSKLAVAPDVEG